MEEVTTKGKVILVLGAASCGKSEWAENLAKASQKPVTYIATAIAHPDDPAWQKKIEKHALRRPQSWSTAEVPTALSAYLTERKGEDCLLIDSLGTWVANGLETEDQDWEETVISLLSNLENASSEVILVGEETGWGVIPAYKSGRLFRDRLGNLTRRIGEIATEVYLVTGGYALPLNQIGLSLKTISND